jgi:phosphomannomutase
LSFVADGTDEGRIWLTSLKFGTSGLRGLSSELNGQASAIYAAAFARHLLDNGLAKPGDEIFIGRDFRPSSPEIAAWCIGALNLSGFETHDCGTIPTMALALRAMQRGAACLMVTGSHIPADRNGIKFYVPGGEITKADEESIAALASKVMASPRIKPFEKGAGADCVVVSSAAFAARNLKILAPGALSGLRVGVYQHSSVARDLLAEMLEGYGADVFALGRSDAFVAVDTEAVAPDTVATLKEWAGELRLDAIVSADGDGDRPLVADETGMPLRGDLLGLMTAEFIGADMAVTPVTSNSGIEAALECSIVRTKVGSPFVIAAMNEAIQAGAMRVLGFEANGGCLLGSDVEINGAVLKALPTRDSFLPILAVLNRAAAGTPLSKIAQEYRLPFALSDRLENFPVEASAALMAHLRSSEASLAMFLGLVGTPASVSDIDGLRVTLADGAIIHFRPSGNAPEMRCYVEAKTEAAAKALMAKGLGLIRAWEKGL